MTLSAVQRKHLALQLQGNELLKEILGNEKRDLLKRIIDTDSADETIMLRQTYRAYLWLEELIRKDATLVIQNA